MENKKEDIIKIQNKNEVIQPVSSWLKKDAIENKLVFF